MPVSELTATAEPGEVGLDADRLQRIGRHFARYVDDGLLAGWLLAVSRRGRVVHVAQHGARDAEAGLPVTADTLWRIYSMTKPITSVAAMILYEEGAFQLTDPVSRFIPSFADVRVYEGGSDLKPVTVPAKLTSRAAATSQRFSPSREHPHLKSVPGAWIAISMAKSTATSRGPPT